MVYEMHDSAIIEATSSESNVSNQPCVDPTGEFGVDSQDITDGFSYSADHKGKDNETYLFGDHDERSCDASALPDGPALTYAGRAPSMESGDLKRTVSFRTKVMVNCILLVLMAVSVFLVVMLVQKLQGDESAAVEPFYPKQGDLSSPPTMAPSLRHNATTNKTGQYDFPYTDDDAVVVSYPTLSPNRTDTTTSGGGAEVDPMATSERSNFSSQYDYPYTDDDNTLIYPTKGPTPAPTTTNARLGDDRGDDDDDDRTAVVTETCTNVYPSPPPLPGKKGVGLRLAEEGKPGSWVENLPKVIRLRPYWNYDWSMKRTAAQPSDIEFVPMIWGGQDTNIVEYKLKEHVYPLIESGIVKRFFGFNEPDLAVQSNMLVDRALELWPNLEALGVPLTSPSCAHPSKQWMQSFMQRAGQSCRRVDWVGVHWYGPASFDKFTTDITLYYEMYRLPIIITEFAVADWDATTVGNNRYSPAKVLAFMKQAVPWLEKQDWVVGYAWFNFAITRADGTSSALFNTTGALTDLGKYYSTVRTNRPKGNQNIGLTT